MLRDNSSHSREFIIENPGKISAQIVINKLFDNNFDIYFIGNTNGNSLYTVQLNNNERAIVGFTDEALLESYVNRKIVSKNLKSMFGVNIVCVQMNICMLYKLLNEDNIDDEVDIVRTIIVNPNHKDFFIPLHINTFSELLLENDLVDKEILDDVVRDNNLKKLSYDKEIQRYCFFEENNF